jgi:hypothetical protein
LIPADGRYPDRRIATTLSIVGRRRPRAKKYASSSHVFLFDTRDTFFQRNPFGADVLDRAAPIDLHVFQENHVKTIGNCPFNHGWLKCFISEDELQRRYREKPVTCSGSTLGSWRGVKVEPRPPRHPTHPPSARSASPCDDRDDASSRVGS